MSCIEETIPPFDDDCGKTDFVQQMYNKYLKLVKLDETTMPEIQKIETKRAFFAGVGSSMLLLQEERRKGNNSFFLLINLLTEAKGFWNEQ